MDAILLKSHIVLQNKKMPDVANKLKISKSALYRKIKGDTEFTRQEIEVLINYLGLSTEIAMNIFFC